MLLLIMKWMIFIQENNKVSAESKAHENIDYEINENTLYQIYNMSLDEKKENTEQRKRVFGRKLENTYKIEIQNSMTCININKANKISECN